MCIYVYICKHVYRTYIYDRDFHTSMYRIFEYLNTHICNICIRDISTERAPVVVQ